MLPMHRSGLSRKTVAEMLVNSSGSDVTAESSTPPRKAPESRVERSIMSI